MPVRPSGAGKQKERPKNEGGTGVRTPGDRAVIAANRHCQDPLRRRLRVAENGELRVNPGAVCHLLMARYGAGKWLGRHARADAPTEWSHSLTYFEALRSRLPPRSRVLPSASNARSTFLSSANGFPLTLGNSRSSRSSAATIAPATTSRANGLLSAGTTYQGAAAWLVARTMCSYASA